MGRRTPVNKSETQLNYYQLACYEWNYGKSVLNDCLELQDIAQ
jgi:hypothetical protein